MIELTNEPILKGEIFMQKVLMNVQTAYHGDILRAGKEYEIDDDIAKRWIASKIATKAKDEAENHD